ncbi:hypothetical protein WA556_003984 [Blastocystis sp. ATCC 50177/Nand II]
MKMIELLKEKAKKNKALKKASLSGVQKEQKPVQPAMPAVEMPQVDSSLPKGVLPADFFDDRVEGAVAMGEKRKDAEKRIQKEDWKKFKEFEKREAEKAKKEEEEIIAALEDRDNAYQLQTEAYRMLLENLKSKDDKLSEDALKEIQSILLETGGDAEYSMSKEEIQQAVRDRKEKEKKKRKQIPKPFDDMDWRG